MRRYVLGGLAVGILYGAATGWPGLAAPELAWWYFGGHVAGLGIAGAVCGAGMRLLRTKIDRPPPSP